MEYPILADNLPQCIRQLLLYDAGDPITLAGGFFLMAFVVFMTGYTVIKNFARLRTLYVLLFSLYFYYKLSGVWLLLLAGVALSDFIIGRCVARSKRHGRRGRGWVALTVIIDVAILAWFKSAGLFAELIDGLYGEGTLDLGKVAAPAGVSFFVFQSISYVIDIYRGRIEPLSRPTEYLFLLSFFPKMFLGPLVDNADFISQIRAPRLYISKQDVGRAARLITGGLIKYAVIAKCLGVMLVHPAFAGEMGGGGFVALMAVYGFTMQIYCDFSGYTDLALGVALLMGFRLPQNFAAPYHSATITEFWRRWHISLSTWLRNYLYISLGGNRRGRIRTYINLILTMFLGGLWHGVGMTFVVWGLLHGIMLALHKIWLAVIPGAQTVGYRMPLWRRIPGVVLTFHIVALGWLFFTAGDLSQAIGMLESIFRDTDISQIMPTLESAPAAFALMAVGYAMHALPASVDRDIERGIIRGGFIVQAAIVVAAAWCAMQCSAMLAASDMAGGGLPIYANF